MLCGEKLESRVTSSKSPIFGGLIKENKNTQVKTLFGFQEDALWAVFPVEMYP